LVVGRSGCSISCVTSRHEILSERSGRDWDAMVRDRNAGGARLGLLKSGRYVGCEGCRVELLCSTRRRHPRVGKVRPCWVSQSIVTHASELGLLTIVDGHSHCGNVEVTRWWERRVTGKQRRGLHEWCTALGNPMAETGDSSVGKRGDRDDQWCVVMGSASLLNSQLTLGTPVVWFAETSNDGPLGMSIS